MPPRKSKKAEAPPPAFPFGELPEGARAELVSQLTRFSSKLDDPGSVARDVAAVTCTSLELRDLGRSLWARLETELAPGPQDPPTEEWEGAPHRLRHEARYHSDELSAMWNIEPDPSRAILLARHKQQCPDGRVPLRVFAEVLRLRCRGVSASKAKEEYNLTETYLKDVPKEEVFIGALGTVHLRRLPDIVAAARRRYAGDGAALDAVLAARAAKKAARQEAERVAAAAYMDGGPVPDKWQRRNELQAKVQAWIEEHTELKKMLEAEEGYVYAKRRKQLRQQACVQWVQRKYGGDAAAAAKGPEVAAAGEAARTLAGSLRGLMRARAADEEWMLQLELQYPDGPPEEWLEDMP